MGAALRLNGLHRVRSLGYYAHPFLVHTGRRGGAARKFRESTGAIPTGFVIFGFRGFAEALQQSLLLVALNPNWREGYAPAANEATREYSVRTCWVSGR